MIFPVPIRQFVLDPWRTSQTLPRRTILLWENCEGEVSTGMEYIFDYTFVLNDSNIFLYDFETLKYVRFTSQCVILNLNDSC